MQEVAMYPTKAVEASIRYCLGSIFKMDGLGQATLVISAGSEVISTVTNACVTCPDVVLHTACYNASQRPRSTL